ncbi:MAG: sugar phosphate isomerase/epimerase [Gammaproteobacteria bacterium]|nr:sugar phosphate isomerase/epimerase [Gammaproteobacteria bacterium]
MFNKFGVMQGRLLPKYEQRYQAHPVGYWQDEFPIAENLGLDSIEFILDYNDAERNPLLADGGLEEIQAVTTSTSVKVRSICADYFMEAPIHNQDNSIVAQSLIVLDRLIKNAEKLGVSDIVIPCVDHSSLATDSDMDRFVDNIQSILPVAEKCCINISLETDLSPEKFGKLLDRLPSKRITVNYDIGNSASLGYDPVEEFAAYGEKVTDLHIKDRLLGGGSVVLGTGNANFPVIKKLLKNINYQGLVILQAYRDDNGVDVFKKQYEWIKNSLL